MSVVFQLSSNCAGPAPWSFPSTVYSFTEAGVNKLALFFPFSVICHLRPKKEKNSSPHKLAFKDTCGFC